MIDSVRSEHIILGIDPGTLFMGYAVLHTMGQNVEILEFDAFDVHKIEGQYPRLQKEFFFLQELIDRYHPSCLAIETQFVDKNPQTMIKIVHAQGVAIAAALSKDVLIYEYSPMKIKMAITGNGHSSKEQVAGMLQRFMHIPDDRMPKKLDATDALAIAYCHYLQLGMPVSSGGAKDWKTYAQRKGLVEKTPSLQGGTQGKLSPAAQLAAALASTKKRKK